jgi:two-component system LytT family response regulator
LLKHDGTVVVVLAADVEWIEAADNYVKVHATTGRYMVRSSIKSFEARLNPSRFASAHRSAIVNLERVRALEAESSGEYRVTLASGQRITLSRGFRDVFRERLVNPGRVRSRESTE